MAAADTFPHRRFNPLTGEWVLVSPHRTRRPWQGQQEKPVGPTPPEYDPACSLCPGNERAEGLRNATYTSTYVFTNDFPALLPDAAPEQAAPAHPLLHSEPVRGTCRVLCFSPRHDLTLTRMSHEAILGVVDLWIGQVRELGAQYRWVQVFENRGAMMGSSNNHPHGQVWASDALPVEPHKEDRGQKEYFARHSSPLLLDYLTAELDEGTRVVLENRDWAVVVPFWAIWPFEVLVLPRRHVLRLPDLTDGEKDALADILKRLLTRYDNLFETSFPYSMGWHGAPTDDGDYDYWQLHAHFYPPLLRSATVRKFLVGYELMAEPQRDITPESSAERLRACSEIHFQDRDQGGK